MRNLGRWLVLQQSDPAATAGRARVIAAQYGLDTNEGDVAMVKRALGRVSSPAILVGQKAFKEPRQQRK